VHQAFARQLSGVVSRFTAYLGFDPLTHDISVSSKTIGIADPGAWGLGWEVWLNGMEVSQFTYFQQVGGLDCRPVMGEITYGLDA